MIPLQTEVKYTGSSNLLAAWWPLFEGPADLNIFIRILKELIGVSRISIRILLGIQ